MEKTYKDYLLDIIVVVGMVGMGLASLITIVITIKTMTTIPTREDVRRLTWGMSKKQVIEREGSKNLINKSKNLLFFHTAIMGKLALLRCEFSKNELIEVKTTVLSLNKKDIKMFKLLNAFIIGKYKIISIKNKHNERVVKTKHTIIKTKFYKSKNIFTEISINYFNRNFYIDFNNKMKNLKKVSKILSKDDI